MFIGFERLTLGFGFCIPLEVGTSVLNLQAVFGKHQSMVLDEEHHGLTEMDYIEIVLAKFQLVLGCQKPTSVFARMERLAAVRHVGSPSRCKCAYETPQIVTSTQVRDRDSGTQPVGICFAQYGRTCSCSDRPCDGALFVGVAHWCSAPSNASQRPTNCRYAVCATQCAGFDMEN